MREYLCSTPFKCIKSRHATAVILSFVDYRHEVVSLMQTISHRTRGFIWSQDGLPGFLEEFSVNDWFDEIWAGDIPL